jgi:hypothetical protein
MMPECHALRVATTDWIAVVAGAALVAGVLVSALRTVVLPQGNLSGITRFMFALVNRLLVGSERRLLPRRLSGLYAPTALVSLPFAWSMLVCFGFALVFWGLDVGSFGDAWTISGSSLFTLGFAKPEGNDLIVLTFIEATIGLGLVALLISFLPTLYTAYSAREQGVAMLAPLTGVPPTGTELVLRLHAAQVLHGRTVWGQASEWFVAVEQSHTAFPALSGFPPQNPDRSWVATAGTVLDAGALLLSVAHIDREDLTQERTDFGALVVALAHGSSALSGIAHVVGLDVDDTPTIVELLLDRTAAPQEIAVTREEYVAALEELQSLGIAELDVDQSWDRFARIRAAYDRPLRGLAGYTHAPPARWTTDRALVVGRPRFFSRKPVTTREPEPS